MTKHDLFQNSLEILEAIQIPVQEKATEVPVGLFRLALGEELKQMRQRAEQGSEMAHGYVEELTFYLSKMTH